MTALAGKPPRGKRNLVATAFFAGCGALFLWGGIADGSTAGSLVGSAALLVAAAFGYSIASPHLREQRLRQLSDAQPRAWIRDIRDGSIVRISGRVRLIPGASLVAPFSGAPCAYYFVRICERTSNEGIEDWREVRRMERSVDFQLEDETGSALVRMTRPAVLVTERRRLNLTELPSPRVDEFLTRARLEHVDLADSSEEVILEQGQIVSVVGRARWKVTRDPAAAAYREAPRIVVMSAPPFRPILICIGSAPALPNA